MWWSKTRWFLAIFLVLAVALAAVQSNSVPPPSPQQKFYLELSSRHAALATECRKRESQARAQNDLTQAEHFQRQALIHDRQSWMLRSGSYLSDFERSRRSERP